MGQGRIPPILKPPLKETESAQEGPLKREIKDFLNATETGKDPLVKGIDGLRDLEIAKAAERSIL